VVAALLTITGYSVNDTIVIFDRVRENQRSKSKEPLIDLVNRSVNQTLSRTLITAGTTFLAVVGLVPVRRRGAGGIGVHAARGHHHGHVLHGVHRVGDRHRSEPQAGRGPRLGFAQVLSGSATPWDLLAAALLGIVQGLTEFLPISSTAHLLVTERLIGFSDPSSLFTVTIQFGSVLAVMWLYREKLFSVLRGLPSDPEARRFAFMILLAFVPAAVVAAVYGDQVKELLHGSLR
jgi:hypothetical protein